MEHKIIPTLADKWEETRAQLKALSYTETYALEKLFYQGIRAYIELQKEVHMELTSFQMDQVLHAWELEAHSRGNL
jgi:hypothetical protein